MLIGTDPHLIVLSPTASSPLGFTEMNGIAYFSVASVDHGRELWRSDGGGNTYPVSLGGSPFSLINVNNLLFFSAYDGSHGYELWKSDGSEAGTTIVKDINPGPSFGFQGDSG